MFVLDRLQPGYMKFYGEVQFLSLLKLPLESFETIKEPKAVPQPKAPSVNVEPNQVQTVEDTGESQKNCRRPSTALDKYLAGMGEQCL
ncbi:hypothetical protein WA1_49420 [Scytonema hofmannii PCC 7110]|uniref:Uncharacterized protein n=2 Tax=Scytonema hofmannii TaxID=34078 RepID=A0A139WQQ3_9CYAN|nr:hypothetical protein WA1_49420 [Scytonema hofmannii PCC 7110]